MNYGRKTLKSIVNMWLDLRILLGKIVLHFSVALAKTFGLNKEELHRSERVITGTNTRFYSQSGREENKE